MAHFQNLLFPDAAPISTASRGSGKTSAAKQSSNISSFTYLEKMDYRAVKTGVHAVRVKEIILQAAARGERIVIDLEDGKLQDGRHVPLVLGFSYKPGWARIFVLDHPEADISPEDRQVIHTILVEIIENPDVQKAAHHGDYDDTEIHKLLAARLRGYVFDTNYSEYLNDPRHRSYKLSEIALRRFPKMARHKEIIMPEAAPAGMSYEEAYKVGKLDFAKVPLKKLILYNGGDCDLTKRVEISTRDKVSLPLLRVYVDAAYTISKMEEYGPLFDYMQADALEKIYPARVSKLKQKLQVMARDPDFNPGSPSQVRDILYRKLKLPIMSKSGKKDTTKETLEILASRHPMPKMVLDYRGACKVQSTYITAFRRSADKHNGRVRTIWWQTGTTTGRNSSGGGRGDKSKEDGIINLQNIHHDEQVKNMLISDLAWRDLYRAWRKSADVFSKALSRFLDYTVFLTYDYSQMEIRMLAHASQDPGLIRLFKLGKDIHSQVGHEITGWAVERIANDDQVRKLVKNLHFGLIYGLQGEGMLHFLAAKGVKTTLNRVNELLSNYFRKFSRVRDFINAQHSFCEHYGYVKNVWGFKIPIEVRDDGEGSFWKNCAVNYPIQGAANQMLRMVLALLKREPVTYKVLGTPHMEIHDALAHSMKLRHLLEGYTVGKKLLEHDVLDVVRHDFKVDWKIPLEAEAKIGFRLGVTVKYKGEPLSEILPAWCVKNQKFMIALQTEVKKAQEMVTESVRPRQGLLV